MLGRPEVICIWGNCCNIAPSSPLTRYVAGGWRVPIWGGVGTWVSIWLTSSPASDQERFEARQTFRPPGHVQEMSSWIDSE